MKRRDLLMLAGGAAAASILLCPRLAELGTRFTHPGTEGGAGAHVVQRVV